MAAGTQERNGGVVMHHRILVGLDGSESSFHALNCALAHAQRIGGQVVGLFVESPLWTPPEIGKRAFETVLRRDAEHLAKQHNVPLEFRVRHGYPAHTIADQARLLGCELVVLGHTDETVLRRWLTGSVSQLVRYEAPCRVVVIRSGEVVELEGAPPVSVVPRVAGLRTS
jgi:nucleotide-binding universal stress UspA family protein